MNDREMTQVIATITGYWNASDQRAAGMARWLNERGVSSNEARNALVELADQYDTLPSIKQLGVKLAELGTATRPTLGVGDRGVISRMRAGVMQFATKAAATAGISVEQRLRLELSQAMENEREAIDADLGADAIGYYRDLSTAIREELDERRPARERAV